MVELHQSLLVLQEGSEKQIAWLQRQKRMNYTNDLYKININLHEMTCLWRFRLHCPHQVVRQQWEHLTESFPFHVLLWASLIPQMSDFLFKINH